MAESPTPETPDGERDPGAPIPKDAIDPELVKLKGPRPKIGIITSAGMVFLCAFFLWKLGADRSFGAEGDAPKLAHAVDVVAGKIATESFVEIPAEPMMSHAIRATKAKGDPGLRVTPVRGTNERLWLVLDGVGWDPPSTTGRYAGRLRRLGDLPFGETVRAHAATNARPVFATPAAVRAALATGKVTTIDGDQITLRAQDRVAFDVVAPDLSTVVATYTPGTVEHAPLLDAPAWQRQLEQLGISSKIVPQDERDKALGQFRLDAQAPVAEVTQKLEGAKLWSARVEPVTRHHGTTWAQLAGSGPAGFAVESAVIPDGQIDLVGLYVTRPIPADAYALIVGEVPQDYWYILPVTIVVAVIGLLFLWALIRALRKQLVRKEIAAGSSPARA